MYENYRMPGEFEKRSNVYVTWGTSDVFPDHVPALCRMAPLLAILPNGLPS